MIVTIAADVLGIENNGTTTACMNLVRYLKARGDEVRILCCDKDKKGMEGYYVVQTRNFGALINKIIERNGVALAKPDRNIIIDAIKDADVATESSNYIKYQILQQSSATLLATANQTPSIALNLL